MTTSWIPGDSQLPATIATGFVNGGVLLGDPLDYHTPFQLRSPDGRLCLTEDPSHARRALRKLVDSSRGIDVVHVGTCQGEVIHAPVGD